MDKGRIPGRILKNNTGKHIPLERLTVRYKHQVRKIRHRYKRRRKSFLHRTNHTDRNKNE